VRARSGRDAPRPGGVAEHPAGVARGEGVVGEHRRVRVRQRLEGLEHPAVQVDLAARRDRARDGETADVVAVGDPPAVAGDQAGAVERAQRADPDPERGQQRVRHGAGSAGEQVGQVPGARVEPGGPGEHRVADGDGQRAVDQGGILADDLGDEERVPAREPVETVGVDVPLPHERRHRRHGQRAELHPRGRGRARDVPEQRA
jgi:hypothetical protein